jgi:multicomponent Na+:H+ antiporter subunit F
MSGAEFLSWSVDAAFVMVMLSVALGFVRLAKGPTLADRVVALDMMTVIIVAFCGLYAIYLRRGGLPRRGIVLALVGFLATVALARFAERARIREAKDELMEDTE